MFWLVLHPRYKFEYFATAKWEDSWIKTAEALIRDAYTDWTQRHGQDFKDGTEDDSEIELDDARGTKVCKHC